MNHIFFKKRSTSSNEIKKVHKKWSGPVLTYKTRDPDILITSIKLEKITKPKF
jgi:hypothetical protein